MHFDVAVVGAGPAGLCFARALEGSGLTVALVEQQSRDVLADPPDDGREIALTHRSRRLLEELGIWTRLAVAEVALLRDALVYDGNDARSLRFSAADGGKSELGWLVPNHAIRRAAFEAAGECRGMELIAGQRVQELDCRTDGVELTLQRGDRLQAGLLVAADSRFSECRRAVGIAADHHDFGRSMLVCRVEHEAEHAQTAWEWFAYGHTLALLPLHEPRKSSAVITVPPQEARRMQALSADAFGREVTRCFQGRLGTMRAAGRCHVYPLVGVFPRRFTAPRFTVVGDAAVGMHPVTAHGFNFGLLGIDELARGIRAAAAAGRPHYHDDVLRPYAGTLRASTRPLYLATCAIAELYSDERAPARALRRAALRAAHRLGPLRRALTERLVDDGARPVPTRFLRRTAEALIGFAHESRNRLRH